MLKTIMAAFAWATTCAVVWAGVVTPPPPAADNDNSGEGLILLVLVGALVFAVAKGRVKPVEKGAPEIVDAEEGAGTGKY